MLNGVNVTRVSGLVTLAERLGKIIWTMFIFFFFFRVRIQAHEEGRRYQAGPECESSRCVGSEEDGDQ